MKYFFVFGFITAANLAHSAPATKSITHFSGQVRYFSADGKTEQGKALTLLKRMVDPSLGRIEETTTQMDPWNSSMVSEVEIAMKRINQSNVFLVEGKDISGRIFFTGEDWDSWTYTLSFKDSTLAGYGALTYKGLRSRKEIKDSQRTTKIVVVEELHSVSIEEYQRLKVGMTGTK